MVVVQSKDGLLSRDVDWWRAARVKLSCRIRMKMFVCLFGGGTESAAVHLLLPLCILTCYLVSIAILLRVKSFFWTGTSVEMMVQVENQLQLM